MSLNEGGSSNRALFSTIEEIKNILSQINPKEALDILHLLRIKYAKELHKLSNKTLNTCEEKIRSMDVSKRAGVYLLVVVNPEGNVILYAGETGTRASESNTSGLEFRIRSHIHLLGKTPLTLFIPNWWVKRIYTMKIEDKEKAKKLEKRLWAFSKKHVNSKSRFNTLNKLVEELIKIFKEYVGTSDEIKEIELWPNLNPKPNFLLEYPPAGEPRGLSIGD